MWEFAASWPFKIFGFFENQEPYFIFKVKVHIIQYYSISKLFFIIIMVTDFWNHNSYTYSIYIYPYYIHIFKIKYGSWFSKKNTQILNDQLAANSHIKYLYWPDTWPLRLNYNFFVEHFWTWSLTSEHPLIKFQYVYMLMGKWSHRSVRTSKSQISRRFTFLH